MDGVDSLKDEYPRPILGLLDIVCVASCAVV
jgi:hypothetical protein